MRLLLATTPNRPQLSISACSRAVSMRRCRRECGGCVYFRHFPAAPERAACVYFVLPGTGCARAWECGGHVYYCRIASAGIASIFGYFPAGTSVPVASNSACQPRRQRPANRPVASERALDPAWPQGRHDMVGSHAGVRCECGGSVYFGVIRQQVECRGSVSLRLIWATCECGGSVSMGVLRTGEAMPLPPGRVRG